MTNTMQTFNVSFPRELAAQIDEVAKRQFGSRSDFLRAAALEYLRKEQERERRNDEQVHSVVSDREAINIANSLLERYKQDFTNLADR